MNVDESHFPVFSADDVPTHTLSVPDQILDATRIDNPPTIRGVLVANAERATQLLEWFTPYTVKEPDFASSAIRSGIRWVLRFGLPTHQVASLGDVRGWIAFANGTIAAPDRPPQPIHATTLSVEVWCEPTVRVRAGRHMHAQIETGERTTHSIVAENAGEGPSRSRPTSRLTGAEPAGGTVQSRSSAPCSRLTLRRRSPWARPRR